MQKLLLTFFTGLAILANAQTETGATCFGWGGALFDYPLPTSIVMPGYDQKAIDAEDLINDAAKDRPWRFGYKYPVSLNTENSGQWIALEEGRIWRIVIEAPGAKTINLLLEDVYFPEGATLFLYDKNRTNKIGAYTSRNNRAEKELGTELIHGEALIVEYFEPHAVAGEGNFTITDVVHGYRSLNRIQKDLAKSLHEAGDCNVDVNCPLGEGWEDQIRSVAMIVVGGSGICSGALINNTCEDQRPLFLTANHCLGGSTANWSFRFNWESPDGTESCAEETLSSDPGSPYDQTANGATVLENDFISDYALLEIDHLSTEEIEEWGCYFAGWDKSDEETVTQATGIHHPSGDLKKICRENEHPYHETASGAHVWWIDDWDSGVTEPGSSGSPLFDQEKRIIGQLYGGAAACFGTDDNDAYDYYGRLGVSWDNGASEHLAPDDCGDAPDILDGFDPYNIECEGTLGAETENEACFGDNSGSIEVTVTGGEAPYTFDIGYGPVASGVFEGLGAAGYTIVVTDNVGCEDEITATVLSPALLSIDHSSTYEILGSDGTISISVTGGTPGYTYSWTGPDSFYSTDEDLTGLVSGLYKVKVTDENGCTLLKENIEVPSALSLEESSLGIRIYPNPSNGQFNIVTEGNALISLRIYDLSGRTVYEQNALNTTNAPVDLSDKSNGTYMVEFITERGRQTQRIVKH